MLKNIAIIGSSGAIGSAFVRILSSRFPNSTVHAFSRNSQEFDSSNVTANIIDFDDEKSMAKAANLASDQLPLDMVVVTTGVLYTESIMPEKSLKELSAKKFHYLFKVNTVIPALIAKHFLPKLNKNQHSIFAALSARVGSISDNQLGGWYAYRASKSALNMIIKNAAIEIARTNPNAIIVGLHPGTVDSNLSKPFQNSVPSGRLFTPENSAQSLLKVLDGLSVSESGKCFAWDGQEIKP